MKKIIYILIINLFIINCTSKKEQTNLFIIPNYLNGKVEINQNHLEAAELSNPYSLIDISNNLTYYDRNNTTSIYIKNGENIVSLEGIDLFPALEYLYIYKSNIINLKEIKNTNLILRDLVIESNELVDIDNIILLKNLQSLYIMNSEKLVHFPNITHLNRLINLSIINCKKINFNNLAEKIPSGIKILNLNNCDIRTLYDISNLFNKNITHFDLSNNLIQDIDVNIDYGTATYIYIAKCPIEDKYFKWDETISDEYPGYFINKDGVYFAFGYMDEYAWVITE